MDNRIAFSQRLKGLRKDYGLKANEFAKHLDFGLQAYYTYESGRAVPSFDGLVRIAETCNVSLDWLCGLSPVREKYNTESNGCFVAGNLHSQGNEPTQTRQHI